MKLVQNEKICQTDIQGIMNYKINLNGTKAKPNKTSSMETETSTTFSKTDTSTENDLNKAESSNQLRLVSQLYNRYKVSVVFICTDSFWPLTCEKIHILSFYSEE